jgi:hypothetical protein
MKDRRREDSRIVSRLSRLSLPKRWKRLNELTEKIVKSETALAPSQRAGGLFDPRGWLVQIRPPQRETIAPQPVLRIPQSSSMTIRGGTSALLRIEQVW